ncbi:MAG: alpha/beta hydrolase [Candidatus Polarisedimenticolia bacterium]
MRFPRGRAWAKWTAAVILMAVLALNTVACLHARAMTHWSSGGARTARPEDLGWTQRAGVLLTGVSLPRPTDTGTPDALGLPFEAQRFVNAQGETLEAWHIPSDSHVLFLLFHGYGASKGSLLPVARALHELGHPALLVDFHGSGGSSGRDTTLGVREALDVAAAVDFGRRLKPDSAIVLYGQSMGGAAVLRSVARHGTSADALVLEATFDRLLTTVKNRFQAMNLPSTPFAHLIVFWGGLSSGIDGFDVNPVEDADKVTCPTLVLHGARDLRVSREEAESVYTRLRGWKRFSEFDHAGHGLVVLSDRPRWEAEIRLLASQATD